MKWWYVGVLIIGIGIGWLIIRNNKPKKVIPEIVNTIQTTTDAQGKSVQTTEITGVVQTWDPDTGAIEFLQGSKAMRLILDPAETVIFTPSRKNKMQELAVKEKSGLRWKTAFCQGNMVVFRMAGDKAIFVDNSGYRTCGFKGD